MALAVHITTAPPYQPPQIIGRGGPLDILNKRQQLTFSTCGLQCAEADFCQQYRSNFGFCCPTSVLTRTAFNYCGPATTCVPYGVSSVSDFFFDSTSSIQYCGANRPSCVTYIYRNDDFTQVFCASGESGTSFLETTSTPQQSATFVGRTTTSEEETTAPGATSAPTATVVENTNTIPTDEPTNTSGSTDSPTSSPTGDSSGGISTGAAAGIGVGAALAGIGAAIGGFFLWRRSNNKKKLAAGGPGNQNFPPQPPMANQQGYDNNTGYYQQQQPYAQVPQGHQAELAGAGTLGGQDYYKGAYPPPVSPGGVPPPQQQSNVYELGGGGQLPAGGGQAPVYHENTAPHYRPELQG
ncbi:uncharacterized protein DFL_000687 [Arthrobotrys flagrans]|uniref:Mid2 domain-containing protein n=1 Tax=Arthrobotrys flagrans TaxID=97331 RepID=A0A437AFI8_ARTFL|nr:hypothetical protein DFL_000687 [Arthrobotrys flagrans]